MAKKTLILSKKQLDEICGGDSSYLDGLTMNPDMPDVFADEISADGSVEKGYADPTTTDDIAHDLTNSWRGNAKLHGMGPVTVRESTMTVKEWKAKYLGEEKEHGNARLKNVQFGAKDGQAGKSYGATKTALCRKNAAEKTMQTGATQEIKQKAANTVARMRNNWSGIDNAQTQYNAAKAGDKAVVSNKPAGTKRNRNKLGNANGVFLNQ